MLKKLILSAALITASVGIGASSASPVEAANCSKSEYNNGGTLVVTVRCTGVNQFVVQRACYLQGWKSSGWANSGATVSIYCSSLWTTVTSITSV